MVEIPYEGPRFAAPDYKSKLYDAEQRIKELEAENRQLRKDHDFAVDQWNSAMQLRKRK